MSTPRATRCGLTSLPDTNKPLDPLVAFPDIGASYVLFRSADQPHAATVRTLARLIGRPPAPDLSVGDAERVVDVLIHACGAFLCHDKRCHAGHRAPG